MTSIIKTSVLRAAMLTAFDRGRYRVEFGTTPTGDDIAVVPASIVLDLGERDDDLFTEEVEMVPDRIATAGGVWVHVNRPADAPRVQFPVGRNDDALGELLWRALYDDHGPAAPAQDTAPNVSEVKFDLSLDTKKMQDAVEFLRNAGVPDDDVISYFVEPGSESGDPAGFPELHHKGGVRVYEFAIQDCEWPVWYFPKDKTLADVIVDCAPHPKAVRAADWVHVYDRETRERRTLKRPTDPAVIKGMADVAADLRGGAVKAKYANTERGAEVFVPAAPTPPAPGPLTSAEGLMRGDVLRIIDTYSGLDKPNGAIVRYNGVEDGDTGPMTCIGLLPEAEHSHHVERFAFVGRPDADGWMDHAEGHGNPVGDVQVEIETAGKGNLTGDAGGMVWQIPEGSGWRINRFRLVDMPPLTGDA